MKNNREYCQRCSRAIKGCLCKFTEDINNSVPITILRHPSEIKSEKGTVDLLRLSLKNIRVIDSEVFNKEDVLLEGHRNILVYPKEDNKINLTLKADEKKKHFIFIDGTWKKAYKIFQLNEFLDELESVSLATESESLYSSIRKQRENGLSTLEAVYEVTSKLDPNISNSSLLSNFKAFIAHLKSFRD